MKRRKRLNSRIPWLGLQILAFTRVQPAQRTGLGIVAKLVNPKTRERL